MKTIVALTVAVAAATVSAQVRRPSPDRFGGGPQKVPATISLRVGSDSYAFTGDASCVYAESGSIYGLTGSHWSVQQSDGSRSLALTVLAVAATMYLRPPVTSTPIPYPGPRSRVRRRYRSMSTVSESRVPPGDADCVALTCAKKKPTDSLLGSRTSTIRSTVGYFPPRGVAWNNARL